MIANELTTRRMWTADDIDVMFLLAYLRQPGREEIWYDLRLHGREEIWYGSIRAAWEERAWPALSLVVNVTRREMGQSDLGPGDFDDHPSEIEGWVLEIGATSGATMIGSGRPIAVAFRKQISPTVFCEEATELEVRAAIRTLHRGQIP